MNRASFDRDITLSELLQHTQLPKLSHILIGILGKCWQIIEAGGKPVLGLENETIGERYVSAPLRVDIEVIGHLIATEIPQETLNAAASTCELILLGTYRYLMVSDLHREAVYADFEALQTQHQALQESEARYRELAAQLEQRVKEQVEVIENGQRQLYQAEKMASVGSLAAGMAHEINNPIGFIRSNLLTAQDYISKISTLLELVSQLDRDPIKDAWRKMDIDFAIKDFSPLLAESLSGADRIARIVAHLKDYASINYAAAASVDLNRVVRTVTNVIGDQAGQVSLEMDLEPLPSIDGDQGRLNQVLLSLVQNALQALEGKGSIKISTRVLKNEIHLSVSDTGCGIPPDVLTRIFDPFFTTREVGKGTGLGLTVSRDIISAHGGYIKTESTLGQGSTFTVCLPITVK